MWAFGWDFPFYFPFYFGKRPLRPWPELLYGSFLQFFLGLLAGIAADVIVPVANDASQSVFLRNWIWRQNLSRFSPATLYWESITTILTPEIRTLGPIFLEQIEGAVPGPFPWAKAYY